jgi:hypothetical protein
MNSFKIVSIATSALFIFLFSQLLFNSDYFLIDLGLQSSDATSVLARRASIFMLGISILLFRSRNLPHSKARQYICLSTGITLIGLTCMGSYELTRGSVNSSILQAMIIEVVLGCSFLILLFKNRNNSET